MIIDLILDRRDGKSYEPREFYNDVMEYRTTTPYEADAITRAMDNDNEEEMKKAIAYYILDNGYPTDILQWVLEQEWL